MELLKDPVSSPGETTLDDDQLPPLLSMIVEGLPPMRQSKYVHEAEKAVKQYVERNGNIRSFSKYCRAGLSSASYVYSGVISMDRLVAISTSFGMTLMLDDVFFDEVDNREEAFLDQYGIDLTSRESPQKMQEYLDHLNSVFAQQQPPVTLIETMMWESGRDMLSLSNPEWFNAYVDSLDEYHHASVAWRADILAGRTLCFQDLDVFTVMREGDVGGKFIQLLVEFASNTYLSSALRSDPFVQKVTSAASIHVGYSNDIYSYHRESSQEPNPRNLITVLMKCEGQPFPHTVRRAIELVNTYARTIVALESEAWNSALQNHLQGIKAFIAGWVYFGSFDRRYRQADSVFPELRDTSSSWIVCEETNPCSSLHPHGIIIRHPVVVPQRELARRKSSLLDHSAHGMRRAALSLPSSSDRELVCSHYRSFGVRSLELRVARLSLTGYRSSYCRHRLLLLP